MTHPPLRVIVADLRTARICLQGARPWFRRHGFDWGAFVAEGIEAERLTATGDAQALRVVAAARGRADALAGTDSAPTVPTDTTPADPTPEPRHG